MPIRIKRDVEQSGWRGIALSLGELRLVVVPDIGGRVLSMEYGGQEIFFVQAEHTGEVFDFSQVADLLAEKRRLGHRLWGGDKTWVSPQRDWQGGVPPLELDAGKYDYQITDDGVHMISPICRETGLRIERVVRMPEQHRVVLTESLTNHSDAVVRRGLWTVTQCRRPWSVSFPAASVRAYAEEGESLALESRIVKPVGLGWWQVQCDDALHFKYGALASRGVIVARAPRSGVAGRDLVFTRIFNTDPCLPYAHDASVEVYNSREYDYLEIEIHAPLESLQPGQSVVQTQEWHVSEESSDCPVEKIASKFLQVPRADAW